MAKTPTYYLPEPFHTMSVEDPYLWLGRIVRHYQVPISAYTPLNPILAQEEVMESVTVENFNITLKSSMLYSAYWRLWNMAGKLPFIRGRIQIVDTSISARQVRGIRLNMEERVFKRVMANPGVEAEVKWCKGTRPVYMIVGLLVADEVIYDSENATRIDDLVGGTFPVSRNSGFWSNAAAQRIFAIQYREVGRRFWALSDSIVLLDHGPKDGRNWVP